MKRCRGTTLLELLVSLVVTGLIALAAHAAIGAVDDARTRATGGGERIFGPAAVRLTLEAWLRAADLVPGAAPFEGRPVRQGALRRDELRFAVFDGGVLWPGPRQVRLRVDHDRATPQRGLVAEISALAGSDAAPADVLELAPRAVGVEIRYLVVRNDVATWVDAWDSDEHLPAAVSLRIVSVSRRGIGAAAPETNLPPVLDLPLVVAVTAAGL